MHTFMAHARQRRILTAIPAVLIVMAIHGAAPATAGGGGSLAGGGVDAILGAGVENQKTANLFGGGGISGGGVDFRQGTLTLSSTHSVEMEKITGMAHTTPPTIGFDHTVKGRLGDGDEVYLNTGQLADLYRFSAKAPKTTYTMTAASRDFPVALTLYRLDPKRQVYEALQETQVFGLESAHSSATLPAGHYAIKINSASIDDQNGRYGLAFWGSDFDIFRNNAGLD